MSKKFTEDKSMVHNKETSVLLTIVNPIVGTFVAQFGFNTFVTRALGVKPISFVVAFGLLILLSYVTYNRKEAETKNTLEEQFYDLKVSIASALILFIASLFL